MLRRSHLPACLLICILFFALSCRTRKAANLVKEVENKSAEISSLLDSLDLSFEQENAAPGPVSFIQEPFQPAVSKDFRLIHTRLNLIPLWDSAQLKGTAMLRLSPWFYPTDSLILDAKGFEIHSVRLLGKNSDSLNFRYEDQLKLRIALNRFFTRHDTLEIEIKYTAKPDEIAFIGSQAIMGDKGLYFINPTGKDPDRPRQFWTQGETEASSCWFPTLDAPNQKSTQEIYLTVPDSFVSLSNGKKISSVKNPDGTRTDYWKQDIPHAPYLFMIAAGKFSVVKDLWNNIPVEYFTEPEFEKYARMIFGNTPEMLSFFSQKFGFTYPWDKYAQIVVRDFVSGAMENTSAVVHFGGLQHDSISHNDADYEDIISHELAHHWFGDIVTAESWSQIALNESFATYGEYLWQEHKYGKDAAEQHLENDLNVYLAESRVKKKSLVRYHYHSQDEVFDSHSYQKGAVVLHYLRKQCGDEAFFAALSHYLKKHQYRSAEIHDLRLSFEEVTGRDYKIFFDQWFLRPGHPVLEVSYEWDEISGETQMNISQSGEAGRSDPWELELNIGLYEKDNLILHPVKIYTADTVFRFKSDKKPKALVFDHDLIIPGIILENRPAEESYFLLEHARNSRLKIRAIQNIMFEMQEDTAFHLLLKNALDTTNWYGVRQSAMEALSFYEGPQQMQLILEAMNLCRSSDIRIRISAYSLLQQHVTQLREEQQKEDALNKALIQIYESGLSDSSYTLRAVALDGLYAADPDKAYSLCAALSHAQDSEFSAAILRIYRDRGDSAAIDLIIHLVRKGTDPYGPTVYLSMLENWITPELSSAYVQQILLLLKDVSVFRNSAYLKTQALVLLKFIAGEKPEYKDEIYAFLNDRLETEKDTEVKRKISSLLQD